ncbi:uridylate-specific endoribonuclease-like [Haliotis cracherodii]|uniref:uridylate-specific endoribonuclease-like n=1 Tax=Haliotis cracherodii TaxID=6455 RepID=UPI0039E739CD
MVTLVVIFCVLFTVTSAQESCEGKCGQALDPTLPCQCNSQCITFGDCCDDYQSVCVAATCSGRCNAGVDNSKPCQCNSACVSYGDCCPDYDSLCAGGDAGGETLSSVADQLWNLDVNRVSVTDYNVNYQGQVSSGNTGDSAAEPFFSYVNEAIFTSRPTFALLLPLLDNYNPNIGQSESLTSAQWAEINSFLDAVLATSVMQKAYNYLLNEGKTTGEADFRDVLKELWFNLYQRSSSGPTDSSGFEHVIVGEYKNGVSGFHSWVQYYQEEKANNIDYQGYVSRANPEIVGAQFIWNGRRKAKGSFFVATSPEFDMAIYSICALVRPNAVCSFNMDGHSIRIQTWDVAHKSGSQIASAYPL